jgi:hypothetical protein
MAVHRWDFRRTSITAIWLALLLFLYVTFFAAEIRQAAPAPSTGSSTPAQSPVDAVVYISLGQISFNNIVDYSVATLRDVGQWKGEIYILTDHQSCFVDLALKHQVKTLLVPETNNVMEIKSLKAKIFEYLPVKVNSALYIDVDIVLAKQMQSFLNEISVQLANAKLTQKPVDMGAFYDAKSHYVGWCSGCEKWHTGVLLLFRESGGECLKAWGSTILSGRFDTDQESLDDAELKGNCRSILPFGTPHLLFAKDYIAMALTSGSTFWHVTAANRMKSQDYFYRKIVVPNLYSSLSDKVDPAMIESPTPKSCG